MFYVPSRRLRFAVLGLQGVVDDDVACPHARKRSTDGRGVPIAAFRGFEVELSIFVRIYAGIRKYFSVPTAGHDGPTLATEITREAARVAYADNFRAWIVTKNPRG